MYSYGGSTQCNAMQWVHCTTTLCNVTQDTTAVPNTHLCICPPGGALVAIFFARLTETEFGKFHTHTYRPPSLLAACSEHKAHVPLLPNIARSQTLAPVYTALLSTRSVALALRLHSCTLARLCSKEEAHRHIVCLLFRTSAPLAQHPDSPISNTHDTQQRAFRRGLVVLVTHHHLLLLVYHLMITTTTRTIRTHTDRTWVMKTMRRDDVKRRCEETMRRDVVDGVVVVVVVTREVKRTNVKVAMIEHRPNAASFIPQCDP